MSYNQCIYHCMTVPGILLCPQNYVVVLGPTILYELTPTEHDPPLSDIDYIFRHWHFSEQLVWFKRLWKWVTRYRMNIVGNFKWTGQDWLIIMDSFVTNCIGSKVTEVDLWLFFFYEVKDYKCLQMTDYAYDLRGFSTFSAFMFNIIDLVRGVHNHWYMIYESQYTEYNYNNNIIKNMIMWWEFKIEYI